MGLFAGTKWDLPSTCDRCGQFTANCVCAAQKSSVPPSPANQRLTIRLEKRKAGRLVTVISGFNQYSRTAELLTILKNACGAGGNQEGEELILQGDHKVRVTSILLAQGFQIRP